MILKIEKLFLSFYCISISRLWILSLCVVLVQGCAVDDIGLVKVRHYENETLFMVSKEAWGAYLSTGEADGGLVFGHTKRSFLYPKNRRLTKLDLEQFLSKPQQGCFLELKKIKFEPTVMQLPVAWISNNQGLILKTNPERVGLALGLESRNVVKLPANFNGIFVFGYNSAGIMNGMYSLNPF